MNAGLWFRRGRLLITSPVIRLSSPRSGRISTYLYVQFCRATSPLGTYNPDWAVTGSDNGAPAIHLISESKSDFGKLREDEEAKMRCGMAHFEALGVGFVKAMNAEDIVLRLVETET
ncbi:hypothetical protein [Sphingorhabdus sp.]|uniref:restriction endonuclease n=1 Tax=Sphingorhabdus sp. TaxID=1902408 RepID=UPI003D81624C